MASILIKNGLIVDGTGIQPEKNDIFIRNGRIVEIGNLKKIPADQTIDAVNAVVAPGFIDIGSEIDHSLEIFSGSGQNSFIRQGITTAVGGNGGWSLAPIINEFSLDFMAPGRQRPDNIGVNFNWRDVKEFLGRLVKGGLRMNFATLAGYSNFRRAFSELAARDLTEKETAAIAAAVRKSLRDGAFGCSINFNDILEGKIPDLEILDLMMAVAEKNGVLALRFGHRLENIVAGLEKVISLAKQAGVNLEIGRFQPLAGGTAESRKIIKIIEEAALGQQIGFDCVLTKTVVVEPRFFLPAPLDRSDRRTILSILTEKEWLVKIDKNFRSFDPEKIFVRQAPAPFDFLAGQSLADFSEKHGLPPARGLVKLLGMTAGNISFFYRNIDEEILQEAALSSFSVITAGHSSDSMGNFLRIAATANWPVEKIIAKLTGQPARKYRITGRGFVKKDFFADLIVLRDQKPSVVIINGQIVFDESGNGAGGSFYGQALAFGK